MHPQSSLQQTKKTPVDSVSLAQTSSRRTIRDSPSVDSASNSPHPYMQPRFAEPHIERVRGPTSRSFESHLNRRSSWADTQASPRGATLLIGERGSRQWCDKLRLLIFFHSSDLFLPSVLHPPPVFGRLPTTHSPILFPHLLLSFGAEGLLRW